MNIFVLKVIDPGNGQLKWYICANTEDPRLESGLERFYDRALKHTKTTKIRPFFGLAGVNIESKGACISCEQL